MSTASDQVFGLSEFLAKPPMYYNYIYGIYKYARVLGVELEVHLTSTGSDPIRVAVGRLPYSDISGVTYSQFSEMPDVTSSVVSAKGGVDSWSLKKYFVAKDAMGNTLTDHSYWITSAQAISATPLHNDDYVIDIKTAGTGTAAATMLIRAHYHVEWFDMQYAT